MKKNSFTRQQFGISIITTEATVCKSFPMGAKVFVVAWNASCTWPFDYAIMWNAGEGAGFVFIWKWIGRISLFIGTPRSPGAYFRESMGGEAPRIPTQRFPANIIPGEPDGIFKERF